MFISVDFPAPFSPRSACTSPLRRSKPTWSFARTPGKRFVMPRSSRTGEGVSTTIGAIVRRAPETGPAWGPSSRRAKRVLLDGRRRLDLAGDDLGLQPGERL